MVLAKPCTQKEEDKKRKVLAVRFTLYNLDPSNFAVQLRPWFSPAGLLLGAQKNNNKDLTVWF